jgi:hypothetical protein
VPFAIDVDTSMSQSTVFSAASNTAGGTAAQLSEPVPLATTPELVCDRSVPAASA